MKHTRSVVVGATAVLAAGLTGATAVSADAQPTTATRILSVQQLHASLAQAVAREKHSSDELSCCPQGLVNPDSTYVAQA